MSITVEFAMSDLRSWLRQPVLAVALTLFAVQCVLATGPQSAKKLPDTQLLVGLKPGARGTGFAKGLGKVVGRDKNSHLIILQLNGSKNQAEAIAELLKRPAVKVALPMSSKDVDRSSLSSVQNHLSYLDAAEDLEPKKERESPNDIPKPDRGDYFEALKYYLERHVAFGSDHIDFQAIKNGTIHKAAMPKVNIGIRRDNPTAPGSVLVGGWQYIGPQNLASPYNRFYGTAPLSGRISCMAYDPNATSVIYAGSGGGGLWKSTDFGTSWSCISDVSPWIYPAVDCIAVTPSLFGTTIYAGTGDFDGFYPGYNQGVMKSTDGGKTWTNLASNITGISNLAVSKIIVDPTNDQIITIATGRGSYGGPNAGTGNIWRSTDSGQTWTSAGLPASDYCALDISRLDGTYYALGAGTPGLMYKSTNQGQTWTQVTPPDSNPETEWTLACSKETPDLIYVVAVGSQKVYKSTDSGTTWTDVSAGLPAAANNESNWQQATYDYYIGIVPAQQASARELVFCGLITTCYSADGGTTWVDYGNTYQSDGNSPALMHNDQHQFATPFYLSNQVLIGNDGGLFQLTINGVVDNVANISFNSLNANLGITQLYKIAPHPTDPTQILGGAQDNASPSAITGQGGLTNWANLYAGDGGWCDWSVGQSTLLTTSDKGTVYQYNLAATSAVQISNVASENYDFIAPTLFSADGTKIFLGGRSVQSYTISSGSHQFTAGTGDLTTKYITSLAVVPGDVNTIYVGTSDGLIWYSPDAAYHWIELDTGTPTTVVGAMSANPLGDHDVLVGFQNTGIQHLWRCSDVTDDLLGWTPVGGSGSTALPDAPISAIVRDPHNPASTWYVATDLGVYVTNNAGGSWAIADSGLPAVQIYDLKYADGYLYAGTFGRGIWRIQIQSAISNFALSSSTVVGGNNDSGTVTLNGAAASGGNAVTLTSGNADAQVPPTVTVLANQTTANFTITTSGVAASEPITITASTGSTSLQQTLTLTPAVVSKISVAPASVTGGASTAFSVNLNGAASPSGTVVSLGASSTDAVIPTSVTVPAGKTGTVITISSKPVSSAESITLTATLGATSVQTTLSVTPAYAYGLSVSPASVQGGANSTLTATLYGVAGPSGIVVSLSSSSADAKVPAAIKVQAGSRTASLAFATSPVSVNETITLTATTGSKSAHTTVTLTPALLTSFRLTTSSIVGGTSEKAAVYLNGLSGASGDTVAISSNNAVATVPATAVVPLGATDANFTVTTSVVSSNTAATLKAVFGSVTLTTALTVTPAPLASITLSPAAVIGGASTQATITLAGTAGPGGNIVSLSSNNANAVVQPTSTVLAGKSSVSFPITTKAVSATMTATITATFNGVSKTASLPVEAAALTILRLTSATLVGGKGMNVAVYLNGPAGPGGATVNISRSNLDVTVPTSVVVPAGATAFAFPITSSAVTSNTTVTLTAKKGTVTLNQTLTLTP